MKYLLALLVVLLTGCATGAIETHPKTLTGPIDVTWHRVGFFKLQEVCKSYGSPLAVAGHQVNGCAVVNGRTCTVYTLHATYEETVGHEIMHCFMAIDPRQ